jgi:predicted nuclease of predicted toxin-antitoxin system
MKLLFDQNISFRIEKKLNINFQFSKHVSNIGLKDADDIEIWKFAKKNHL